MMMMNSRSSLIAAFATLPACILAQQSTNSTANTNSSAAPVTAAAPNASAPAEPASGSNANFTPTPFTPIPATATECGTAQQNFNQCITKVGKDISSCTDNVCLCQTYANIAACYNGCKELEDQGKQYQAQSSQYCSIAGVKPNTTATTNTSTTTTPTSSTSSPSNTSPIRNSSSPSSTNTTASFSAAKPNSAFSLAAPSLSALGGFAVVMSVLCL